MTESRTLGGLPDVAGLKRVSRETMERLDLHLDLVRRWTARINLVAPSTLEDAWLRHIVDSAQLLSESWPFGGRWLDLGSGAGFPGLVIAILLQEHDPAARVTLVESDRRKATFLRQAAQATQIPVTVLAERAESLEPLSAQIITARALAPVDRLCALASPHLVPGGELRLLKGKGAEEEIDRARAAWSFDLHRAPSVTEPQASVLILRNLHHV